jgi:hypothetical protein
VLLEDDLSFVPYNVDSQSHKSDAWHPPRELADVSGPYSGRDWTTNSFQTILLYHCLLQVKGMETFTILNSITQEI